MRRFTTDQGPQTALLAATVALLVTGCGGTNSDKAGGAHKPKPTVLTMANGNDHAGELEPFAAAVARLSGGTLRIEFKNGWRNGTPSYETGVIGDVKAGKADLAWAGSRAFDSVGVPSFDALHAPMLIDSYALERRALESPLVGEMLDGLKPLGVVGLGILPGPMRKPLGVTPLVRPQDYDGKTLAVSRSQVAQQTLNALGARGAEIPSAGAIRGYDGIEQQLTSIDGNGYDKVAKYLTANVNLWPRPLVLFTNSRTFDELSSRQRAALRGAARVALAATLAAEQASDKESAGNLCRRGVKFVTAGDADLAALRRAVQPVYDRLGRHAPTRAAIEQIESMRSETARTPDAPTCSSSGSPQSAAGTVTPIDGRYRVHITAKELLAAGSPDALPENYGSYEMTLDRGRFTQRQPMGYTAAGTYTVTGDTVTLTYTRGAGGPAASRPGEVFDFRWSRYRDQLTLAPVKGKISPENYRAKPWRRLGDARTAPGPQPTAPVSVTAIDGVYSVHTTPADLRAVGASEEEITPANYGTWKLFLKNGRFTQQQPKGHTAAGTYTAVGDTITLTITRAAGGEGANRPGEVFDFRWSLYRGQLTLEPVEGKISPAPLRAKPWRRLGNAR